MNANALATERSPDRLNRIRRVAGGFKWLCVLGFALILFVAAKAMVTPEAVLLIGSPEQTGRLTIKGPMVLSQFEPQWKWLWPIFWVGGAAFLCRGLWYFYRLFGNIQRGIIFDRENVGCLREFGWWLVACPLVGLAFELSKLIWTAAGPGTIEFWPFVPDVLRGVFVIFVAWIMDEGRRMQEEQALTV